MLSIYLNSTSSSVDGPSWFYSINHHGRALGQYQRPRKMGLLNVAESQRNVKTLTARGLQNLSVNRWYSQAQKRCALRALWTPTQIAKCGNDSELHGIHGRFSDSSWDGDPQRTVFRNQLRASGCAGVSGHWTPDAKEGWAGGRETLEDYPGAQLGDGSKRGSFPDIHACSSALQAERRWGHLWQNGHALKTAKNPEN